MTVKHVVLLFGGKNTEHEVSVASAKSIYDALDRTKFRVTPVAISKSGAWLRGPGVVAALDATKGVTEGEEGVSLLPDPNKKALLSLSSPALGAEAEDEVSVVFPVIHGRWGEDGALQGLLEMANLPYVGSGVLGSSVGMDKVAQKQICLSQNIPIANFTYFTKVRWGRERRKVCEELRHFNGGKFPLFVKPANTGSSVGISKVKQREELEAAIDFACQFDNKIIVEEGLENVREIETAVLGNYDPEVSVCGEIVPCNEFYDYNAKYIDDRSVPHIPAQLAESTANEVRRLARETFLALDLRGLSRVDFFVSREATPRVWLNEVNTMPGFTKISMYPKMWDYSGVKYPQLVEKLIELALEEWALKQNLETNFVGHR